MSDTILDIRWELDDPAVAPNSWREWAAAGDLSPSAAHGKTHSRPQDAALEASLGWPPATIALLRGGFAQRLGRDIGWAGASPAVAAAACVFRRGVAHAATAGDFHGQVRRGHYQLTIHAGTEPPLTTGPASGVFTILDANVAAAWPGVVAAWRDAGGPPPLVLGLNEHTKTLTSVAAILTAARVAAAQSPTTPQTWRVVGGGLLADVAAFAAGLAGVAIAFVPTTLLAMADACVGGKTGVNFAPYGKNQLGLFYFPSAVHVWAGWLATLPPREVRAGGAECLKHAFLSGDLQLAEGLAAALAAADVTRLTPFLPAVIAYKAHVVTADPGENGARAALNFGHTLAHALEALAQKNTQGDVTLVHGEAVGLGMLFALFLSHHVAGLPADRLTKAQGILQQSGILLGRREVEKRIGVPDLAAPAVLTELVQLIAHDKKNTGAAAATAQWILLSDFGAVARDHGAKEGLGSWTTPVAATELAAPWQAFIAALKA